MPTPSPIELALYHERANRVSNQGALGDHCVLELAWIRDQIAETDVIQLKVAPCEEEYSNRTTATFPDSSITSVSLLSHDPDELKLPWEIVSFESEDLGNGRWGFDLNCRDIRWTWESAWPMIEP